MDNLQNHRQFPRADRPTAAEVIKQLGQFDGSGEQFFVNLLAVQCYLSRAEGGAILRNNQQKSIDVLAIYPQLREKQTAPSWLNQSAELIREAAPTDAVIVKPLQTPEANQSQGIRSYFVSVPLKMADIGQTTEVFLVRAGDNNALKASQEQLTLTAKLLGISEQRLTLQKRQAGLRRLQKAMETLSAINRQNRFTSTAMALCNEAASQWQCERVSVGFLKGRYVQLKAMSRTEDFSRKMKIVQDIESAME